MNAKTIDLSTAEGVRTAMKLAGLKPHKSLGQHFLVDAESLDEIVAAAQLSSNDSVLEIGPGLGVLTEQLAKVAGKVTAIETDKPLAAMLDRRLPSVAVVVGDVMKFDLSNLAQPYKVVANLPYYITSPILRLLSESANGPELAVLLVQKEVAQRITAEPGQLSVLALAVQYYMEPEVVATVDRDKFWPSPKVDSAVLRLRRRLQPAFPAEPDKLFRLIKAGFGEKRKQLKNTLAGGLHLTTKETMTLLAAADIAPTLRAQNLSLDNWHALYTAAHKQGLLS